LTKEEEFQKHLDIKFIDRIVNWYEPEGSPGRFRDIVFPARYCTQEDFGETEEAVATFLSWTGITILCPDLPPEHKLHLEGDLSSMISNRYTLTVSTCNNESRSEAGLSPCYPPE